MKEIPDIEDSTLTGPEMKSTPNSDEAASGVPSSGLTMAGTTARAASEPAPEPTAETGVNKTTDIVEHFKSRGLYLKPLGDGKHAVTCPCHTEHSNGGAAAEGEAAIGEAA